MKSNTMSTLGEDYVTVARARGLSGAAHHHRLRRPQRDAAPHHPTAISIGFVVGGSILIESIFVYQGIGFALRGRPQHPRLPADAGHLSDHHHLGDRFQPVGGLSSTAGWIRASASLEVNKMTANDTHVRRRSRGCWAELAATRSDASCNLMSATRSASSAP